MKCCRMGCGSSKDPVVGLKSSEVADDDDGKEEVEETKAEGKEMLRVDKKGI